MRKGWEKVNAVMHNLGIMAEGKLERWLRKQALSKLCLAFGSSVNDDISIMCRYEYIHLPVVAHISTKL